MELEQRRPSTAESTFPFFRNLFGMPPALVEWFERMDPVHALREMEQMRVEEYVEDGDLVIRADLPGIDPEKDVTITVQHGRLQIRAERRQERTADEDQVHRSEIRYGSFTRSLPLPEGARADDVSASYRDGVLTVRLPLPGEQLGTTRIPVTRD